MSKRGVVLAMNVSKKGISGKVDPMDLRRYLLYWDYIDFPHVNFIGPDTHWDQDVKLLKQENIFQVSQIQIPKPKLDIPNQTPSMTIGAETWTVEELNEVNRIAQYHIARTRTEKENNLWSIVQSGNEIHLPVSLPSHDIIESNLINCLPVLSENVNINNILEFKEKRKDQLLRFRRALDNLNENINKEENAVSAVVRAKEEIELSLVELHKVLDETKLEKFVSTLKVYLDLNDSALIKYFVAAGLFGAGATLMNLSGILGAGLGLAINASLSMCTKKIPKIDTLAGELRDYAYLYEIDNYKKK